MGKVISLIIVVIALALLFSWATRVGDELNDNINNRIKLFDKL